MKKKKEKGSLARRRGSDAGKKRESFLSDRKKGWPTRGLVTGANEGIGQ